MPSAGRTLVTTQSTGDDHDNDYEDNDNIIPENPRSGGNDSCSSGLQGCLGVPDPPAATSPQSHSSNVPPSPDGPQGQPDRGEKTAQVRQAEQKYPTLQLALPMYQPLEFFYLHPAHKQMFILMFMDNEQFSDVFHALYKKA